MPQFNYLFFLIFFFCVALFTTLLFQSLPLPPHILLYSLAQALLEVLAFSLISQLLRPRMPNWAYFFLISFFFIALLVQFTSFFMMRLIDAPFSYFLKFLFGNPPLILFQAMNLNSTFLILIFAAILLTPLLGICLYKATYLWSRRKPLFLSIKQTSSLLSSLFAFALLFEWVAFDEIPQHILKKYENTLPLGTTLLPSFSPVVSLPWDISPPQKEAEVLAAFDSLHIEKKPNIYLFVIETFRKDFIDITTAPFLTTFGRENISIPLSFSNANSTHLSWFSIFYSQFPYRWPEETKVKGAIPLQVLKNLGYQIYLYSSSDFLYFNMENTLFGKMERPGLQFEDRSIPAWKRDALLIETFEKTMTQNSPSEGNVFLFFLDATHSEYSFPDDLDLPFLPIKKEINYLTFQQKDLPYIKNRYRNAIHYVDSLMGKFFQILKEKGLYEEAIIVVTGDHGEEFFEEGALFHGTHLNKAQTNVPLLFKYPTYPWKVTAEMASHIDIFPSILHYLTGNENPTLFDGQSIFLPHRRPYRMAMLQNGGLKPTDFVLSRGDLEVRGKFVKEREGYYIVIPLQNDPIKPI